MQNFNLYLLISMFVISVGSSFAAYCPPDRYLHDETEGGVDKITRKSREYTLEGRAKSYLYEVYRACRIEYRTEETCTTNDDGETVCTTTEVPYQDFYTKRILADTQYTYFDISISKSAWLVSGEKETFKVSYNAYHNRDPKVTLPSYYNEYDIKDIYEEGYNRFKIVISFHKRNKVRPPLGIENFKIRKSGSKIIVKAQDIANRYLAKNDNSKSKVKFYMSIKKRNWFSYNILVRRWEKEFDVNEIPENIVFDAGPKINSSKKHKFSISIKRTGSKFYNEEKSIITYLTFYPRKLYSDK